MPSGSVYGKWTVLECLGLTNNRSLSYLCRCECGAEKSVPGTALRSGATTQCRKCASKDHPGLPPKYEAVEGIVGSYLVTLESGAASRGYSSVVTMRDLANQWRLQDGKCALTGWELSLKKNGSDSSGTASVDRIDSTLGYFVGNFQWLHKDINMLKNKYTEDRFFEMCNAVTAHKEETVKLRGARPWLKGSSE